MKLKLIWDLKNLKSWNLNNGDYYVFKGHRLRKDDPGNIHFGYVGSVLFPVDILQAGAGAYQVISKTSKWYYFFSFFDDPRDSCMIMKGANLFACDLPFFCAVLPIISCFNIVFRR